MKSIKTVKILVSLITVLCMIPMNMAMCAGSEWDSSIRFIDLATNETVTDAETTTIALSCIELAKNSSENPFTFKAQDVQYAKSKSFPGNDYFLIAYSLGEANPKSCFVAYDRPSGKAFIYGFDELIYNRESTATKNDFYIVVMQFTFEKRFNGTLLNQGNWKADDIGARMEEFYQYWEK